MEGMTKMDLQSAEVLLKQYVEKDSLMKHCMAVQAAMEEMARVMGGDVERWAVVGLLHDIDYEKYPEEHAIKAREILESHGVEEEIIRAVQSHAYGMRCDVEPISDMEKAVYAVDEMTGLVNACVLVRPSKSIMDLTVKSVKKKWKDKAFAAAINRDVIQAGADRLNMPVEELMGHVINGMQPRAEELGIKGDA